MLTNSFYPHFFTAINRAKKVTLALALSPLVFCLVPDVRAASQDVKTAVLAGGCFWCIEKDFERVEGVKDVVSGYTGGATENPTYQEVTFGGTGHYEAVKITYDPSIINFEKILTLYWRSIDATDAGGQFCDRGHSYKTAIFYQNDTQKRQATESKNALVKSGVIGDKIATPIIKAGTFWPAETYHQNYYKKNPFKYKFYRSRCGRDDRVKKLWGDDAWAAK